MFSSNNSDFAVLVLVVLIETFIVCFSEKSDMCRLRSMFSYGFSNSCKCEYESRMIHLDKNGDWCMCCLMSMIQA